MSIEYLAPNPKSKLVNRITAYIDGIKISIRAKLLISFLIIILLMVTVNSMMFLNALNFNRQYDAIITNITAANSINGFIKPAIDTEMWNNCGRQNRV